MKLDEKIEILKKARLILEELKSSSCITDSEWPDVYVTGEFIQGILDRIILNNKDCLEQEEKE